MTKQITNGQLKNYVFTVYNLEKDVFLMTQLKTNLESIANTKPEPPVKPTAPKKPDIQPVSAPGLFLLLIGMVIVFFRYINHACASGIGYYIGCLYLAIMAFVGFRFFKIIAKNSDYNSEMTAYEKEVIAFQQKLADYQQLMTSYRIATTKCRLAEIVLPSLSRQLTTATLLLKKAYGMGIIAPKYRSLVPVSSLCEYLQNNLCSSLEGASGAYRLYELYSRMDHMIKNQKIQISQTGQIMTYLSPQLRQNQQMLSDALSISDATVTNLINDFHREAEKAKDPHKTLYKFPSLEAYQSKQKKLTASYERELQKLM